MEIVERDIITMAIALISCCFVIFFVGVICAVAWLKEQHDYNKRDYYNRGRGKG